MEANKIWSAKAKLQLLKKAESSVNISTLCEEVGISRPTFYFWKKRYEVHGEAGLSDTWSNGNNHPNTTPASTVQRICHIALESPDSGGVFIQDRLRDEGISISIPCITKKLKQKNLFTLKDRLRALEVSIAKEGMVPSQLQSKLLLDWNPNLNEFDRMVYKPGEVVVHSLFCISTNPLARRFWIQTSIDRSCCLAIARIEEKPDFSSLASFLGDVILPFYRGKGYRIGKIGLEVDPEIDSSNTKPYKEITAANEIVASMMNLSSGGRYGFTESFRRNLNTEFLSHYRKTSSPVSLTELNSALAIWLTAYNQTPQDYYPNFGKSPYTALESYR